MAYAKVTIPCKIITAARPVTKRKQDKDGKWQDSGEKAFEYGYLHEGADIITGKLTIPDGTLENGKSYNLPLRVEFKDANIRVDSGVPVLPVEGSKK